MFLARLLVLVRNEMVQVCFASADVTVEKNKEEAYLVSLSLHWRTFKEEGLWITWRSHSNHQCCRTVRESLIVAKGRNHLMFLLTFGRSQGGLLATSLSIVDLVTAIESEWGIMRKTAFCYCCWLFDIPELFCVTISQWNDKYPARLKISIHLKRMLRWIPRCSNQCYFTCTTDLMNELVLQLTIKIPW